MPARPGAREEATKRQAIAAGAGVVAGASAGYFLDPQNGRRRRNVARDRVAGLVRRGARSAGRAAGAQAEHAKGMASGAAAKATSPPPGRDEPLNDAALAQKVQSEVFREPTAPKGSVSVNVENRVVYLRGEVRTPEEIESMGKAAAAVDGVHDVENLLHLPKTPAPTR
jgi:hypothetical protein